MEHTNIWQTIVYSNTFNFAIFLGIIIYVAKKIDVAKMIGSLQEKIQKIIDDSKHAKNEAVMALREAQNKTENVANEVKTILEDASKTAGTMSEKILDEAKKQIENIEKNAQKNIEGETQKLKKNLSNMVSKASVKLMKQNLQKKLNENKNLHQNFIDEAINEIEKLEI